MGAVAWDAQAYHRISEIQERWARAVLDRLELQGDETVLDAGCGSGRVTELLLERLPRGRVIGVDASAEMIAEARGLLGNRATLVRSDLVDLGLSEEVDAVFSNAVFHWVLDHDRLFARLAAALRPGGRLVAQCGGSGNVQRFIEVADGVIARPPFARHFAGWRRPWYFSGAEDAERALRGAGFSEVRCWLAPSTETPEHPTDFLRVVCLGSHLSRLPEELHPELVEAVRAELGDPLTLDYVRLNIEASLP